MTVHGCTLWTDLRCNKMYLIILPVRSLVISLLCGLILDINLGFHYNWTLKCKSIWLHICNSWPHHCYGKIWLQVNASGKTCKKCIKAIVRIPKLWNMPSSLGLVFYILYRPLFSTWLPTLYIIYRMFCTGYFKST